MDKSIFITMSLEEYKNIQRDVIREILNEKKQLGINKTDEGVYLSRKEVKEKFKISYPTLNERTKDGTIKGYRFGRRVLYKKDEVENALKEIRGTHKLQ